MNKNTYFITGGGTGGHIYPAVAVADELLTHDNVEIYYVGNPDNLEASIAKSKNYKFLPVKSSGMPRKLSLKLIPWTFGMFFAWLKCCYYLKKYKPEVVFGTGGYVSAPTMFAATSLKVPFVMHDCDANPGLVTRKLAPFAKSLSVAFDAAKGKLDNKNCFVNGNPIRTEFLTLSKEQAREELNLDKDRLVICIMGGSQGAKSINSAAIGILEKLSQKYNVQVIFQTGKKNYEDVVSQLEKVYPNYQEDKNIIIKPYFDNMVSVLKSADIAVSRAGSLSISELCASEVAAIFVPYPHAAADHQRKNAKCQVEQGAGLYLEDSDVSAESLLGLIEKLISNRQMLDEIQQNSAKLAKFDGVKNIVAQILECKKVTQ